MSESIDDTLSKKSSNRQEFDICICADDVSYDHTLLQRISDWATSNGYNVFHIPPTDPINIEGEWHPNHLLKLSLLRFKAFNPVMP